MATQGLLSVTKGGKVLFKVVAGCEGFNIPSLAKTLRIMSPHIGSATPERIYQLCERHGVGCHECLVVQYSDSGMVTRAEDFEDTQDLYRSKFTDPAFNPRLENGTAAYSEVIEIP